MHRVTIRTRGTGGQAELDLLADAVVTFSRQDESTERMVVCGVAVVLRYMGNARVVRYDNVAACFIEDASVGLASERNYSEYYDIPVWLCDDIVTASADVLPLFKVIACIMHR